MTGGGVGMTWVNLVGFGRHRKHVHLLARPAEARELHLAVDEREQRVVLAAADVLARVNDRAALADEDHARRHGLAAELLHAQPLAVRLAAVLGRGLTFFVRHVWRASYAVMAVTRMRVS